MTPPELGEHAFQRTQLKGALGEGEFIGSFFVKGVPPKGAGEVHYVEMLGQYEHEMTQALEKEPSPADRREQVRRYFDARKPPPAQTHVENPGASGPPSGK